MTPDPIGLAGGINLYAYVSNNPINAIDPFGLTEIFDHGSYTYKKYTGDTMHGGDHWHVEKRRGGKLLGRVGMDGRVITGNVPKKALKILVKLGKVGGAAAGIILELAIPAQAGPGSDIIPDYHPEILPIEPPPSLPWDDESPCE